MKLWLPASKAGRCFEDTMKHTSWSTCSPCPQHCVIYWFTSSQDHLHCYATFISASWVNEPNPFIHTLLCVIYSSDAFWALPKSKVLARRSEEHRVTPPSTRESCQLHHLLPIGLQHSQHHTPCYSPQFPAWIKFIFDRSFRDFILSRRVKGGFLKSAECCSRKIKVQVS